MDSRLDTTLIQHVASKGFQLFGKLLDVPSRSWIVGRNDIQDASIEVAFTSSLLKHFVESLEHSDGEAGMVYLIDSGGLSTANRSASACARVFDEIEHGLIRSVDEPNENFRPIQENLRTTLGEARRILTSTIQGTLKHQTAEPSLRSSNVDEAQYNHIPPAKAQILPFERSFGDSVTYRGASTANIDPALISPLAPTPRHDLANVVDLGADEPTGKRDRISLTGDSSFTLNKSVTESPGKARKQYTGKVFHGSRDLQKPEEIRNSNDGSVLSACTIMPVVRPHALGHYIDWLVVETPLQEMEVKMELRRLHELDSRSICEQLDSLTLLERCALAEYIALTPLPPTTSRWPHGKHIVLLAAVVEHIKPPEELEWFRGRLSERRVKIVVSSKRQLNPQNHSNNPNSYPWVRVHRKHMSPRLLDDRGLPWEWDYSNPNYLIIKRWIPQNELDMLFDRSRDMRRSQDSILDASPSLDPYQQPTVGQEQNSETDTVMLRRRFCKPLTNTLARLGFIKDDDKNKDIAKGAIRNHGASQNPGQYYHQREPNPGESEKVAELWKTRKDIEIEIEELERQKIELRIQRRNEDKQRMVNHILYITIVTLLLK